MLSAALLVLGGTFAFFVLARGERTAHLERWHAQLQAMADDRRSAVDRWLAEGLGDASIVASYPTAVELASRAAGDPASVASEDQVRAHLTAVLQSHAAKGGYLTAMVLAANGRVIASGGTSAQLDDSCMELVRNTLTERRPMADLHRHLDGELVVQLTAPVLAGRDASPVGASLLAVKPEVWLFPFLRHQPALSDTAETVLWRRDGSSAVLLSPTRHPAAAPIGLRRPLDLPGFAARSALEGRELFTEAVDYRGVPVLAVTRRLEAAPWGIVTKVDREEALRGYRTWRAGALALLGAFAIALVAVAYAGWERRRLQDLAEVEEGERRYRLLAENISDVVWVLDLDSGRFLFVSPSVERLTGFTVEEVLAQGLEVTLTPESAKHLRQVVSARLGRFRTGAVDSFVDHVEQRCKDGSTVWVEATSRAVLDTETGRVKVYGSSRDITDRKRAESALRDSEEQLRAIFELASVGLAQADPGTGRWLRVNQRMCAITGYPEAEMLRMRIPELIHPDDRDQDWEAFQRVVRGEAPDYRLEKRYLRKDGTVAWVNVNMTVIRDAAGIPVRTIAAVEDITERKQAEAAVLRLNTELEQRVRERTAELEHATFRLEAANHELEAFSYSVSHDLRAPLRAIDGFSRMLAEDHADRLDAEAQRLLGVVRANAQQMGQLIGDLLSFSRLGRAEMRSSGVSMVELVRAAYRDLAEQCERPAELALGDLPAAVGDPAMLRQLWVNLLSNALKFTAPRGSEGRVEVRAVRQEGEVVYEVRDNGVGFDMRHADKLFGVFQRLHRQSDFPGTGVGLALVQRIVHRHGGRIWATAAPGEGATFYFTLGGSNGSDETG